MCMHVQCGVYVGVRGQPVEWGVGALHSGRQAVSKHLLQNHLTAHSPTFSFSEIRFQGAPPGACYITEDGLELHNLQPHLAFL